MHTRDVAYMWRKAGPRAIFIQCVAFQLGLDAVALQEAAGWKGRRALMCVAFLGKGNSLV